jgi:hypothetical protein
MNAEELTELEHRAIDTIEDVIGHLGPDHAAGKALGEDKGAAEMAEGDSTDHWMPLVFALKDLAEQKRKNAHAIRDPERGSLPALSKRARSTAEAEARPFDDLAQWLEAEAQELTERLEAVTDKRKELELAKEKALEASKAPSAGVISRSSRPHWRDPASTCSGTETRPSWAPTCANF